MRRLAPLTLALCLSIPATAQAVDLDVYLEAWTVLVDGGGGTDDADRAWAVGLTTTEHVVVAGSVDGPSATEGHDALVFELDAGGTELWRDQQHSGPTDAWFDLALDPLTNDLALCGAAGDPVEYAVELRAAGLPPTSSWVYSYQDGAQSPEQECRATSFYQARILSSGWADSGTENGVWLTFTHDNADGHALAPPLRMDEDTFEAVPDRAHGLAVNAVDGSFVVVGERGVAGNVGSDLNDADLHIVAYDPASAVLWQYTVADSALLLDVAEDVAIDPATGDVYVVGWLNRGSDNAAGMDRDWYVARFLAAGDGAGAGSLLWSQTYTSVVGADEVAMAVVLDDVGDVLVAGTVVDGTSGNTVFGVHRFAAYDGTLVDSWLAPAGVGDAVPTAIDFRSGLIVVGGWEDTGAGLDAKVTLLDVDGDGDGVADAADACPTDSDKFDSPGVCGCGVLDQDTDGDTVLNCDDACPANPTKAEDAGVCGCEENDDDTDTDGTPDCVDDCPTDPLKADGVGECGCGSPDTDSDGDGVLGCNDACINTPPDTRVDENGCPRDPGTTDTETGIGTGTDTTDDGDGGKGCGCDAAGSGLAGLPALLALALLRRRR
jgi:hypothetical protein